MCQFATAVLSSKQAAVGRQQAAGSYFLSAVCCLLLLFQNSISWHRTRISNSGGLEASPKPFPFLRCLRGMASRPAQAISVYRLPTVVQGFLQSFSVNLVHLQPAPQ